jgi:hypothetical protein
MYSTSDTLVDLLGTGDDSKGTSVIESLFSGEAAETVPNMGSPGILRISCNKQSSLFWLMHKQLQAFCVSFLLSVKMPANQPPSAVVANAVNFNVGLHAI